MDKGVFIKKIESNQQCIMLDAKNLCPNEIYFFTNTVRGARKQAEKENYLVTDEGKYRVVRIEKSNIKMYDKVDDNSVNTKVLHKLLLKNGDTSSFVYGQVCKALGADSVNTSGKSKGVREIVRKVHYRVLTKYMGFLGKRNRKKTFAQFLSEIKDKHIVSDNMQIVNRAGSTGAVYIRDAVGSDVFFIKGNEFPPFRGIYNEAKTLKYISNKINDHSWYLDMIDASENGSWIKYPYVEWKNIPEILEARPFTDEENNKLGEFLVFVLDNLYELKIIHNDLRPENIMVEQDEFGNVKRFILIDFGCASISGEFPWEEYPGWGEVIKKQCGGHFRYSKGIVDDAASALMLYANCSGTKNETLFDEIEKRIGRHYLCMERKKWKYVRMDDLEE